MDVQLPLTQRLAAIVGNEDFLVNQRAVVRHQHGQLTLAGFLHHAGNNRAVGTGNGDAVAPAGALGLNVHGKVAVKAQESQRAVLRHAGGHVVADFRVDCLDPTGHTGGQTGGGGVVLGAVDAFIQRFQLALGVGQGVHDGGHIHLRQKLALCHQVSRLREHLVDLHPSGDFDFLLVHLGQHTAAGDKGVNGAGLHLIGQHLFFRGGEFLFHAAPQRKHQQHQRHRDDRDDDNDGAHHLPAALFLFPIESFE